MRFVLFFVLMVGLGAGRSDAATVETVRIEDLARYRLTSGDSIADNVPSFGSAGPVSLSWGDLEYWSGGYSNRAGAACDDFCSLQLTATPGNDLTLVSFFIGSLGNQTADIFWEVAEIGNPANRAGGLAPGGQTGVVVSVNLSAAAGFELIFQDQYYGGINDITYSYAVGSPVPVPLPATGLLLAGALAGLATQRRKTTGT